LEEKTASIIRGEEYTKQKTRNREQSRSAEDGGEMFFLHVSRISMGYMLLYPKT
jgi:hypothetical protein